ncbi:hypothetical protein BB561_002727 [Smittium simulii]|uniref:Uncharacterized protein n=1 Tax=Smittium simulii TaxID=133385 RepID=A0A2T9YPD9_9FUNG|nr:hypothetical protein BB561_002727 [Smittium simulii]
MKAKMQLVGKLLGWESKKTLLQLQKEKKPNMPPSMELETAKFMDGIRVARTLILDRIKCLPTPLNRCPVGMEFFLKEFRYLGFLVSKEGIFPDPAKFVPGFSEKLQPITDLTKKTAKIIWAINFQNDSNL